MRLQALVQRGKKRILLQRTMMAMLKAGVTKYKELLLFQGREAQVLDFCFVVAGADGDEGISKISGAPSVVSVCFRGSHVIITAWPITPRSQTVTSATTRFLCALMHADGSGTAKQIPDRQA